jgi:cobalt-zinc-cadmium efflux system membrane fusion protein
MIRAPLRPFALLLVIAALGAATACRRQEPTEPGPPEAATGRAPGAAVEEMPETVRLSSAAIAEAGITTWTVQPVDLQHLLVLNGTVGYNENRLVQIAANVRGRVASMPLDLGAAVRRGATVLEIESVDLGKAREEYLREAANARVASLAYERAKKLVEAKAISAGEFQSREGDYLSRQAAADAARRALHLLGESDEEIARLRHAIETGGDLPEGDAPRLRLRAPFAGRLIDRKVTPGSLFDALQPLATLADLSSVWVFFQAYEKDLALLQVGLPATIRTEAYPQETFRGKVDFLGSVVDPATRTVKVRATVANTDERLRPGMFVKAQVDVPRPRHEAARGGVLAVPQAALQTLEGRGVVFVERAPGLFARHFVETGHTFEGFTEVLAGVKENDVIVTEGSFVLKSEFAKASLVDED